MRTDFTSCHAIIQLIKEFHEIKRKLCHVITQLIQVLSKGKLTIHYNVEKCDFQMVAIVVKLHAYGVHFCLPFIVLH